MVCNAASNPYYGPLSGITDEQFQKIMQNNIIVEPLADDTWSRRRWPSGRTARSSSCRRSAACSARPRIGAYNISKAADLQLVATSPRVGQAQHPRELHRARPDPDRLRQGAVGQSGEPKAVDRTLAAEAHRRAGRHRRRRGVPGLEGRHLRRPARPSSSTAAGRLVEALASSRRRFHTCGVIVPRRRAIQYSAALVGELALTTSAAAYWMPRRQAGA